MTGRLPPKNLQTFWSLQIRNRDGSIAKEIGPVESHSFVKQFAQLIFNVSPFWLSVYTPTAVTDTDGDSITAAFSGLNTQMALRTDAATGTSAYGIQVGSSTAAESINDTKLTTQIAHGTSAGQLQYGTVTYGAPTTTATTTTFRTTRVFTNGSGGNVTVEEIGLACRGDVSTMNFLLLRDLTTTQTVANGQSLTVNYDFTTTI